eukprot:5566559-Lingulodinium_polyedra.AAC.1
MGHGSWIVGHGLRGMGHGSWVMDCGVWVMGHKSWVVGQGDTIDIMVSYVFFGLLSLPPLEFRYP